ncbi:MAG: hypothetical protein CVV27_16190, partial [Candidatus Melainabacteria bacterium HGW-Melainabacteria-1]
MVPGHLVRSLSRSRATDPQAYYKSYNPGMRSLLVILLLLSPACRPQPRPEAASAIQALSQKPSVA